MIESSKSGRPRTDSGSESPLTDTHGKISSPSAWGECIKCGKPQAKRLGTALKPSAEDWWLARKPMTGTVAQNVLQYGTGALNIGECRVRTDETITNHSRGAAAAVSKGVYGSSTAQETHQTEGQTQGRWPPNTVFTHSPDCGERCTSYCPCAVLDQQTGQSKSPLCVTSGGHALGVMNDDGWQAQPGRKIAGPGDSGGASRFFPQFRPDPFLYTAKAASAERPRTKREGASAQVLSGINRLICTKCAKRPQNLPGSECQCPEPDFQADSGQRGIVSHPTVKPLELMRWLVRLVTPPGGVVLDCFAGSGTTGEAALMEGMRCILIERDPDYLPLIVQRLTRQRDPIGHAKATGTEGDGLW